MNHPSLAQDIMVTKLVTLTPQVHVWNGIEYLLRNNISGAPVVDRRRTYLGVFSEKCCLSVLTAVLRGLTEDGVKREDLPLASEIMTAKLVTLSPENDVFEAIEFLLKKHISGAPVIDREGHLLGVFSEKTSMRVLIEAAYNQLPTSKVEAFTDKDPSRIISDDLDILQIADRFISTSLRRLPVVRNGKLLGQISRRDVLRSGLQRVGSRWKKMLSNDTEIQNSENNDQRTTGRTAMEVMDRNARTIDPNIDFLSIAQIFLDTPYRRLPVVREGELVGQVSRRDLLQAANDLMEVASPVESNLLYLSSLRERSEVPIT